jgi:hypothetical protein
MNEIPAKALGDCYAMFVKDQEGFQVKNQIQPDFEPFAEMLASV